MGTCELGRRKEQRWPSQAMGAGGAHGCTAVGSHWGSGWETAESWVGWKPTCGNADGCLYFLAFFFFMLGLPSWVSSACFHRAVEVGSIRAASFSIKLGF